MRPDINNINDLPDTFKQTPAFQKYSQIKSKLEQIKSNLPVDPTNPDCEMLSDMVDGLFDKLDNSIMSVFKTIDKVMDVFTSLGNCVLKEMDSVLRVYHDDFTQKGIDLCDKLHKGEYYQKVYDKAIEISENIEDWTCEQIKNHLNDMDSDIDIIIEVNTSIVQDILDKMSDLFDTVSDYLTKAVGIIRCIGKFSRDITPHVNLVDPKLGSILEQANQTMGTTDDKIKTVMRTIKQVEKIDEKLSKFSQDLEHKTLQL